MTSNDEPVNGPRIAAQILEQMDPENKKRIVQKIEALDPDLADKISENIFAFNDICTLPAKGIQVLAQSVNHHDLVLALKNADQPTRQAILKNVSSRKRTIIEDELPQAEAAPISDVNAAQKRILKTLDDLRTSGKVKTGGEQDLYV
jgi:flagellar motor switch protein FliG